MREGQRFEEACPVCGGGAIVTEPVTDEDGVTIGGLDVLCDGCGRVVGHLATAGVVEALPTDEAGPGLPLPEALPSSVAPRWFGPRPGERP